MIRRGQKLVSVWLGPWEPAKGVELSGIAGPVWYYARCYLELESGEIYELGPGSIEHASRPDNANQVDGISPHLRSPIADVVIDNAEDLRVVYRTGPILRTPIFQAEASLPLDTCSSGLGRSWTKSFDR